MSDRTCAFCGAPDARHRVLDSIVGQCLAGDSVASVAEDHEYYRDEDAAIYDLVTAVLSDRLGRARGNAGKDKVQAQWQAFVDREQKI